MPVVSGRPADRPADRSGPPRWRRVLAAPLAWAGPQRRPVVATPAVMALASGGLYVSGGVLSLIGSLAGPHPGMAVLPVRLLAVGAVVMGLVLLASRRRLPRWFYHLTVVLGTVLISVTVALSGSTTAALAYGSGYAFVAIDCFFFFSWPAALVQLATAIVGAVVAFRAVGVPAADATLPIGVTVAVALAVGWLVRQADSAEVDGSTGLPNRRGFDRALREAVDRAAPADRPLALAFVDLRHLEQVGEQQGRARGDRLLRVTAQGWEHRLHPGQLLARFDGSVFALLLPGGRAEDATALVRELRGDLHAPLTCSAGIAVRQAGDSATAMVERADAARHEARRAGGDRVAPGSPGAPSLAELRRAIAGDELFLAFQPVLHLASDRVVGFEALVRWRHPTRGVLGPDAFVPAAEAGDLIHDLGLWVATEACRRAARWRAGDGSSPNVAVNVAGPELASPGYAARLLAVLRRTGLAADHLVLEVTETTMDADAVGVVATLSELRAHGVKIALDDFGTGYSSLNRLDRLPLDILKIDRSFIEPLDRPGADTTVLQAVVALAAALGVDVVAEGIETDAQDAVVRGLGCAFGQGYLYGRPREVVGDSPPGLAAAAV